MATISVGSTPLDFAYRIHTKIGDKCAGARVTTESGTNDRAELTGQILEDEKILGTVHVAFGASAGIGGTVSVPIHLDAVVLEPTLIVDETPVIESGRYVLDGT